MKLNNVIPLNALPIVIYNNVHEFTAEEKKAVYEVPRVDYIKRGEEDFNSSVKISKDNHIFRLNKFSEIKKLFDNKAKQYRDDVLEVSDTIFNTISWITINKQGSSHAEHIHRNCLFSMLYYAQCDAGDLRIVLERSRLEEGYLFHYTITKNNIFNSGSWSFPLRSGDMIIFPGHLRHSTTPNTMERDRIVFASNYFLGGKMGNYEYKTAFELTVQQV
jgi:uncharacterized protein (TIGR02466 family)